MASTCPANPPPPDGYRVWVGAVPPELTDWALDLLNHQARGKPYGTQWQAQYLNEGVVARLDHHAWTHRNGQLVYGCFAGITLYRSGVAAVGEPAPTPYNVAMYTYDNSIDWPVVGVTVAATALVIAGFLYVVKPEVFKLRRRAKTRRRLAA